MHKACDDITNRRPDRMLFLQQDGSVKAHRDGKRLPHNVVTGQIQPDKKQQERNCRIHVFPLLDKVKGKAQTDDTAGNQQKEPERRNDFCGKNDEIFEQSLIKVRCPAV